MVDARTVQVDEARCGDWHGPGRRPMLLLFLRAASIRAQRLFLERLLGLPVLENRFHPPHHHHGVVKYDVASSVLALNANRDPAFPGSGHDGARIHMAIPSLASVVEALRSYGYVVTELGAGSVHVVDDLGRVFMLRHGVRVYLDTIDLAVADVARAEDFYCGALGLPRRTRTPYEVTVAAGDVTLRLHRGEPPTRREGFVVTLYARHAPTAVAELSRRGVVFEGPVAYSDIGGAVRLRDPDDHALCLYEPSGEALSWESGTRIKVLTQAP